MKLLEAKTSEQEGKEKHIPIIEGNKVQVGSVEHPMTEEHYIKWIELTSPEGKIIKFSFKPGEKPILEPCFEPTSVRTYCNLHGLWKS